MKKVVLMVLSLMLTLSLMACETMKGFARDVENTGDNIWSTVTKKK